MIMIIMKSFSHLMYCLNEKKDELLQGVWVYGFMGSRGTCIVLWFVSDALPYATGCAFM
jgi:hypothetical protein